jgi:hypothetical protein
VWLQAMIYGRPGVAFGSEADIGRRPRDVRFVPIATKVRRNKNGLFDHLVTAAEQ